VTGTVKEVPMRQNQALLMLIPLAIALGLSPAAKAQGWDWQNEEVAAQMHSFDSFLHNHPWIARKLWEQPSRVNDRDFVNDNKELKEWLQDHPAAAQAFHEDPRGFMDRDRSFRSYGADFDSGDAARSRLARFDQFLDGHPNIRRDLMRRPGLVNNDDYLEDHPALRAFFRRHPEIRDQLRDYPGDFMQREEHYQQTE
jgi:hypothetical protein